MSIREVAPIDLNQEPLTCCIVTAVCTRLATASILDDNRNKLSDSFFFLIALAACNLAPSMFPF